VLERLVDDIELALQQRVKREVSSNEIGELVLEQLKTMSEVAYVRFASVYRQFRSVSDFVATLEGLGQMTRSPHAKQRLSVVN
jgi:transcriptional repressor NrdR